MEERTSQIQSIELKTATLKETMGTLNLFIEGKRKELEIIKVSVRDMLNKTSRMMKQKSVRRLNAVMKL